MRARPNTWGGIAAALVLAVGMLIVGFSLPSEHSLAGTMRWMGAFGLVFGVCAMGVALSQTAAGKALWGSIAALLFSVLFICSAAASEITGKATLQHWHAGSDWSEPVTRESAPVKFRLATNIKWGLSVLCGLASLAGFRFYHRARSPVDS